MTEFFTDYITADGAFGSKSADLFPTMASFRTLAALGSIPSADAIRGLQRAIRSRRAAVGGVGAQPGQPPDVWSTAYAIDALWFSHATIPDWLFDFVRCMYVGGGFSMAEGQEAETWSTAFALVALSRSSEPRLPDPRATLEWLHASMVRSGGFTWSPAWASRGRADVRATAFVVRALNETGLLGEFRSMADLEPTTNFLLGSQDPAGGFSLDSRHPPCLWGAGEAVAALSVLDASPLDAQACVDFVRAMRRPDGGYRRGLDYPDASDAWATMHAVLIEEALSAGLGPTDKAATVEFVESCSVPGGGSTYRPPTLASDVLVTSAAVICGAADQDAIDFLRNCRMPGERGVAYMPARGSEARSANWAVTALDISGSLTDPDGIGEWARQAQNPDGGFGPWEGRASNAVSTCSVVAALSLALDDPASAIDVGAVAGWLKRVLAAQPVGDPDADLVELSALTCAARTIGVSLDTRPIRAALAIRRRGKAWTRNRSSMPELLATYSALTAHQALGDLELVIHDAAAWTRSLPADSDGTAWSALGSGGAGPLPSALAALILAASEHGVRLPNLTL